jgi:hypothetical protein
MQTSSKVTNAKKIGFLASLFHALFSPKMEKAMRLNHNPAANIQSSFQCRSSQSRRRKLARRRGY